MKKIIACISLVFAMSAGVTALAADATYSEADNSASIDATGYTTVLIEDAEDTILYVDQNDSGLGSAAKFLLKGANKLADGTYTVTLGGSSTLETTSTTFTVAARQPIVTDVTVMGKEVAADGQSYSIGCKAKTTLDKATYVVITAVQDANTANAKTVYYPTNFTGEGDLDIAVKISEVPSNIELTVGLSDYQPE